MVAWGVGAAPARSPGGPILDWRGQDFHGGATCQVLGAEVHCGADNEWGLAGNRMPYVTTYAGPAPTPARVASRVVGGARYVAVERVRAANNLCARRPPRSASPLP